MSGTEPPRRKRFQIHLSTAVVMMFVAGGLIWANLRERRIPDVPDAIDFDYTYTVHGWPFPVVRKYPINPRDDPEINRMMLERRTIFYESIILNFLFSAGIVAAVWFSCEWL